MNIRPSTAQDYVIRAMRAFVPKETAQQVLEMELQRLDQMQTSVFELAAAGDIAAIEVCLKIQNQRARLLGLYPDKPSPATLSIGDKVPNAEDVGIRVVFVRPSRNWDDYPTPVDITPNPASQLPPPKAPTEPPHAPSRPTEPLPTPQQPTVRTFDEWSDFAPPRGSAFGSRKKSWMS